MTITLEIPSPLFQRLYRCEDFLSWSEGKPAGTRRPLEELILQELEGFFIPDELDLWKGLMTPLEDGEGN